MTAQGIVTEGEDPQGASVPKGLEPGPEGMRQEIADLITQVERLTAERDEARLSIGASDAANQLGGLVGASAHDLHLEMERRLAERAVKWKARADTLAAENERLKAALTDVIRLATTASSFRIAQALSDIARAALAAGEPAR